MKEHTRATVKEDSPEVFAMKIQSMREKMGRNFYEEN